MSAVTATLLAAAMVLAICAPALIAFIRSEVRLPTIAFYGISIFSVFAYHLGFSVGSVPVPSAASANRTTAPTQTQCEQAVAAAERGRIIVDRDAQRLVVDEALWPQIPEAIRNALVACAESLRPEGSGDEPLEVVNRSGS